MRPIKGYEMLAPDERFRLAVKAQARDDGTEFGRLQYSCPRKQYDSLDWEYVERAQVAQQATLAIAVDISHALGQLHAVTVLARVMEQDWLDVVRQHLMRRVLDLMAAFDRLAQQFMGLSAETLLAAHCRPVLEKLHTLTRECDYEGDADGALGDELMVAWAEAALPFEPHAVIRSSRSGS